MILKKKNTRPVLFKKNIQNEQALQSECELFEGREKVYGGFYNRIFPLTPINLEVCQQT